MVKRLVLILGFLITIGFGLILSKQSQANVDYHYRYQILTQGSSYEANQNLEIKLYIKVTGEEVTQANVTVNYDSNSLQLKEVKKWDIFDIDTDTATVGSIKIVGTSPYQFSGEAPLAYLYFKTLRSISDLNQVLTINSNPVIQPTSTPAEANLNTPTPAISPTQTTTEAPTALPTNPAQIDNCPNIEGGGSLTLVIIPDHYTSLDEFAADAKTAVDYLKNTNLSSSILNKFTFRYSTDITKDYNIHIDPQNIDVNLSLARLTQQDCDGDAFLILSKKYPNIASSSGAGGFSMISANMAVVFQHSLFVVPHELGHGLPGLFDEYNLGVKSQEAPSYYNCAGADQTRCQEWKQAFPNDENIGCFKTCGYRDWYRSTQFSAMNNNPSYMNYYNPPSLKMWADFMNLY